jgi:hypothetical protein
MSQSRSPYQQRRGLMGTSGKLAAIEGRSGLRARQERRIRQSCTIAPDHSHGVWLDNSGRRDMDRCNGVPWPSAASRRADASSESDE